MPTLDKKALRNPEGFINFFKNIDHVVFFVVPAVPPPIILTKLN